MSLPETIEDTGFTIHAMEEPPSLVEHSGKERTFDDMGDKEPIRRRFLFQMLLFKMKLGQCLNVAGTILFRK